MVRMVRVYLVVLVLGAVAATGCGKPSSTTERDAKGSALLPPQGRVIYSVIDNWGDLGKYYRFGGGDVTPWEGSGLLPPPQACLNGVEEIRDPVIAAHPAYTKQGEGGETILRFALSLPEDPAQLTFGVFLSKSTAPSDGVDFQVYVERDRVFGETISDYSPQLRRVDLSGYAGKTVNIELITGPGPHGNPQADWARWLDPKIVAQR